MHSLRLHLGSNQFTKRDYKILGEIIYESVSLLDLELNLYTMDNIDL